MSDEMTTEQFSEWQATHKDELEAAAEKAHAREADDQYDIFVEEMRKVIPGSHQLSAEQLRSLAINMDLNTTRHAGEFITSLTDAYRYTGERGNPGRHNSPAVEGGRDQEEVVRDMNRETAERLAHEHVDKGDLGVLVPTAGAAGKARTPQKGLE